MGGRGEATGAKIFYQVCLRRWVCSLVFEAGVGHAREIRPKASKGQLQARIPLRH